MVRPLTGKARWAAALAAVVLLPVAGAAAIGLLHVKVVRPYVERAASPAPSPYPTRPPQAGDFPPDADLARSWLGALAVEPGREQGSYDRSRFGFWNDDTGAVGGRNGCDTRSDLLIRDLSELRTGDRNACVVLSGVLHDPYTGRTHEYRYRTASQIESDHVVALGAAWRSGAWAWTDAERNTYFNDLDVLLAVDKQANQDKGGKTPDKWLPQASYHCEYARRWTGVKHKYRLTVTRAEKAALAEALDTCG